MIRRNRFRALLLTVAMVQGASGYSVLSHEAIIDAAWDGSIKPILLQHFPAATEDDLRKAHAFTYGGAIIQDMGYYPFGSHFFSDLTHYVRSGDFVQNLLAGAQDIDEYAFALGALAHYASDNVGHIAVNQAVPMLYPKVRAKFGDVATYEDNPTDHLKAEFSFDVAEVAEHNFAPNAYHDFIGFEVSKPLLERAFEQTYGISLKEISLSLDLALGTYRHTVSSVIPEMTKVAWQSNKKKLTQATPGLSKRRFVYVVSRASYEKEWGSNYEKPRFRQRLFSFLFHVIPKIGPFKALSFQPPTPAAQKLFMDGFVKTSALYAEKLAEIRAGKKPDLENSNFDIGKPAHFGVYHLADDTSAKLLLKLEEKKDAPIDPDLRKAILNFYGKDVPTDPKAAAALGLLRSTIEPGRLNTG
ncbi:MAG: zinc dependent phospholipase C family protein, partial [Terriglobia bacterium]